MSARWTAALQLAGGLGAVACGAVAYRGATAEAVPWWQWCAVLAAGWTLLALAFREPEARPTESRLRAAARWAAGVVAMGAGAAGVVLGSQPGREMAAGLAIIGALAALAVARWRPFGTSGLAQLLAPDRAASRSGLAWRVPGAAAALTMAVVAIAYNLTHHRAGALLWAASLVLFAAAVWRRGRPAPAAGWRGDGGPPLSARGEALGLLVALVIAVAFRMTVLRDVPAYIHPDEGRQGRTAEQMWDAGFPDLFNFGWNSFANLSYAVEYLGVQALGTSNESLRLSAATVGVLSIVPVFFWVRRWWGGTIAVLAALLLAINREHIWWSRIALNNIHTAALAGLMLATFARALRSGLWRDWVWFGYATGLAFHTYHSAKLFPALLAAGALVLAVGVRGFMRRYAGGALVGAVACVLCWGPLIATVYRRWTQFYVDTSNRVDLHVLADAYARDDVVGVRQYIRTHVLGCLFVFTGGDYPMFDPFASVPFVVGLGWMLWRWRDVRHVFVLAWLLGILVVGGMITDYPPWKARLVGLLPTAVLVPAIVVGRLRGLAHRVAPHAADWVVAPLVVIWLAAAAYHNWHTEFVQRVRNESGDLMTAICRAVERAGRPAAVYMAGGEGAALRVSAHDCMIPADPERRLVSLWNDPALAPVRPGHRGNAVLLVAPDQRELRDLVRHYYPDRYEEVVRTFYGAPVLHQWFLPAEFVERSAGLERLSGSVARWRGQIWIPSPGPYAFRSTASGLRIDGTPVNGEQARPLAAGWHGIAFEAQLDGSPASYPVEWRSAGAGWAVVPRDHFAPHAGTHGLLGRYFAGRTEAASGAAPSPGVADHTRIDPLLAFDWHMFHDERPPDAFAARPAVLEWIGTVELPEGDAHAIRLDATTRTEVYVDGALVLSNAGDVRRRWIEGVVRATSGRVPVLVRSVRSEQDAGETWRLRLLWREPNGDWTAVARYAPALDPALQAAGVLPKER